MITVNNLRHLHRVLLLLFIVLIGCEYERIEPMDDDQETVTFAKANGADPNLEQNQDRITDNVWLTRGNSGGQIYNARVNSASNKQLSPVDTEWALGTVEELESLTFDTFRGTIQPKDVVGKDLVLHLITDDVYLNIRFTAWSSGREGGFAYIRDSLR
ncbi:MAG: hypothetical protein AAGA85_24070 [Bacteroidota bacterium]